MTDKQPEALRLAEWFDEEDGFRQGTKAPHKWVLQADAELRRLHEVNAELVEALKQIIDLPEDSRIHYKVARRAIAKVTGEQQ
jgi:hypothetical protein